MPPPGGLRARFGHQPDRRPREHFLSLGWTPVFVALGALASVGFVLSFLLWKSERGPMGHGLDAVTPTAATEAKPVEPR